MRIRLMALATASLAVALATPVQGQREGNPNDENARGNRPSNPCVGMRGTQESACREDQRRNASAASRGTTGIDPKEAKRFNDTAAAASAKLQARDFAGAAATYQSAIDAAPNSPVLHRYYLGLAIALRQQGTAAFNDAAKPTPPGPGASNDEIRTFNAAVQASEAQRRAAALPLLHKGQEAAAKAATLAATSKDHDADANIGIELRQDAYLLYLIDRDGVLRTPRPSADLEASLFRNWLAENPNLPVQQLGLSGIGTAATLAAKDPAAGLTLADEVQGRAGDDVDTTLSYAGLVAAKAPVGDPRRAKALAGLARIEGTLTDPGKRARAQEYRKALGGA